MPYDPKDGVHPDLSNAQATPIAPLVAPSYSAPRDATQNIYGKPVASTEDRSTYDSPISALGSAVQKTADGFNSNIAIPAIKAGAAAVSGAAHIFVDGLQQGLGNPVRDGISRSR